MKFVILEKGTTPKSLPHLLDAAKKLNLEPIVLDVRDCSNLQIKEIKEIKESKEPYLLYSTVDVELGYALEAELFTQNATTFYSKPETIFTCRNKAFQAVLFQKNEINLPKTILNYAENDLKQIRDELGGFPLIIKTNYGERGVGVLKIDSYEGLTSVLDFLKKQNINHFLQKFIQADFYVRTIFVGHRLLGSIRYDIPKDDFRLTTMKNLQAKAIEVPEFVIKEAIRAMELLDTEFAGIDFLVKDNKYFLTEVNFPCIYLNSQELIKENISEEILKYLIEKQKRSD